MVERSFSRKCGQCRQRAVVLTAVPYTTQVDHDGRKYEVTIPDLVVPRCANCSALSLDEEANRQISAAFRQQAGLLSPAQIRSQRVALGLTQQALADLLGVAVFTLSRWETGAQIQQRSLDRFLRAVFKLPALRLALQSEEALEVPPAEKRVPGEEPAGGAAVPALSLPPPVGSADGSGR